MFRRLPFLFLSCLFFSNAYAATPVVDTTIVVDQTGTTPFDGTTWDGSTPATAGFDANATNNVVRLQDSITYRIEASVNDGVVDNLVATVTLDKKQAWVSIPTGCQTDAMLVSPVSSISADKRVLVCNMGAAAEGTNRVVLPAARVVGISFDSTEITLNDDTVTASVSTQGTGPEGTSNTATAGPASTIATANFRVDLDKYQKNDNVNYRPIRALGPGGLVGYIIEWEVFAEYAPGSMIADSDEVTFEADYDLLDIFGDDNTNNNAGTTGLSSNGLLFDPAWDPSVGITAGCTLLGDNGPSATVTCTQVDIPLDFIDENGLQAADGLNDPNIHIDLNDIDVRDPDKDSRLFRAVVNIWYPDVEDIDSHQACVGSSCTVQEFNEVQGYNTGTSSIEPFPIVSTEDASSTNLPNYGTGLEPQPNNDAFPLIDAGPGNLVLLKTFQGNVVGGSKNGQKRVTPGEIVNFTLQLSISRKDTTEIRHCENIDTVNFEYQGIAPDGTINPAGSSIFSQNYPNPYIDVFHGFFSNFRVISDVAKPAFPIITDVVPGIYTIYYSNQPHVSQKDDNCVDDINGDFAVNFDPTYTATSDWVLDPTTFPGGVGDTTKILSIYNHDGAYLESISPDWALARFSTIHQLLVRPTVTESTNDNCASPADAGCVYLPNFAKLRNPNTLAWTDLSGVSDNPTDAGFSFQQFYADRVNVVGSTHTIIKYTEPRGVGVVRGGDIVDFIIESAFEGLWPPSVNTANITDVLPVGTSYVPDSEEFSTDGGTTWLSHADYLASSPDVTLTSPPNTSPTNLVWDFGDIDVGEQLPLVRYSIEVALGSVLAFYTNTATLTSDIGADIDNNGSGDPVSADYQIIILPEFGLAVVKANREDVYSTNTPFFMDLVYQNLGAEAYTAGDFIGILPYNGDGAVTSSGKASSRDPGTTLTGGYELTELVGANGETFYATDFNPALIPTDPCHGDNLPLGYTPAAGDVCERIYNANGGAFPGGSSMGTGVVQWSLCTTLTSPVTCGALDPVDITAIRFETTPIPAGGAGRTVSFELTPFGNIGGTPDIDSNGDVTAASTGDIYTSTFGGRIPEIGLDVISNDASVTVVSGSIGDFVWFDADNDGVQDPGEPGIPNVEVSLEDSGGNPIYVLPSTGGLVPMGTPGAIPYVVTTDVNGNYTFNNLPSQGLNVVVNTATLPPGLTNTFDPDGGADSTSFYTLMENRDAFGVLQSIEDNVDQDFGYFTLPASLGDRVWEDTNGNGIQDGGEMGVSGVTVMLYNSSDQLLSTQMTDGSGNYLFNNLPPGDYYVVFSLPAGFGFTGSDAGGDDSVDSDANTSTGRTPTYNLSAGENELTVDAGIVPGFNLGNNFLTMWNGICDQGNFLSIHNTCGVSVDVIVELYNSAGGLESTNNYTVGADEKQDISVDGMGGFSFTDYGLLDVTVTPSGCVDGEMGLLTFDPTSGDLDNYFSTDLQPTNTGTCWNVFNIFNPSLDLADSNLPTTHWLQISNGDTVARNFTVNRYNFDGSLVSSQAVSIAAKARQDIAAGHEDGVANRYGLVEVIPENGTLPYIAQLFRYGTDTTTQAGERMTAFTLADNCMSASATDKYISVSAGAGAANWLELSNQTGSAQTLTVEVYSNTGGLQATDVFNLGALQSLHYNASQHLGVNESGMARISSSAGDFLVKSSSYYYRSDGKISAAYTNMARGLLPTVGEAAYNTYLDQINWLRMYNPTGSTVNVQIEAYNASGTLIGTQNVSLAAERGLDFGINSAFSLGAGVVGKLVITPSTNNSIIADVVRVRYADPTFTTVAEVISTPVR